MPRTNGSVAPAKGIPSDECAIGTVVGWSVSAPGNGFDMDLTML